MLRMNSEHPDDVCCSILEASSWIGSAPGCCSGPRAFSVWNDGSCAGSNQAEASQSTWHGLQRVTATCVAYMDHHRTRLCRYLQIFEMLIMLLFEQLPGWGFGTTKRPGGHVVRYSSAFQFPGCCLRFSTPRPHLSRWSAGSWSERSEPQWFWWEPTDWGSPLPSCPSCWVDPWLHDVGARTLQLLPGFV